MHLLLTPIDLNPDLGGYLLKYADREFLTNALAQEESARARDAGLEDEPGFLNVLNALDLQNLRCLAYETAATNAAPSDPAREQILRIDRDGVFQISLADVYLGKMVHALQSLAVALGNSAPQSIDKKSVMCLLGQETRPLHLGADRLVIRKGGSLCLNDGAEMAVARRHLTLLNNLYSQFKAAALTTRNSDRHATRDMGIK
ncbi:hypothetical protein DV532_29430 (plasmid) [Pseudomonas sp. Leaf58]|uniref:hypothetical protein n=1 Tax=Pseudomonas sp. Leaf58 TaxID=1736226 RepID=UPI0006F7D5DE|nr:hypothetical protein [Pseudomonas sp. Leaf58]AYG48367.1 hypothetical protein DV532_29430 [Pseudomonas sp. Leaf58]KQN62088.1 hypothetical protein ASF02_07870 [Pseudomonas sp. Leaf58]